MTMLRSLCRWLLAGLLTLAPSLVLGAAVEHYGHFQRMMKSGDTSGKVALQDLSTASGTWGVGALEGLRGEIIQVDGRLLVSPGSDSKGGVRPPQPGEKAALWATGRVAAWREVKVPADLTLQELEAFIAEQAKAAGLDPSEPFVFRLTGQFAHLLWHVVTGEPPKASSADQGHAGHGSHGGHANKRTGMVLVRDPSAEGQLVGVSSGAALEGVVSHPGERLHLHFIDPAETVSGHVDKVTVKTGASLWLPADPPAEPVFTPKAERVAEGVYAIVGPLGQRSVANAGLNANYGFIIGKTSVILIDSGASSHSAALLQAAVRQVTKKPIRWVLNTGSQDHRWLGNDFFAQRQAEVLALAPTVATQTSMADQQITGMRRFVGDQMKGTRARPAGIAHAGPESRLTLDGVAIHWIQTDAHYPGDTLILLPESQTVFTGDLVYVDRILGILPLSNVRKAQAAFQRMEALRPSRVVPGHGRVTDIAQARRETGDYYDFLIRKVGEAAQNMEPIGATLDRYARPAEFTHLQNFDDLHRANMNRVFVDFEANP